MRCSWGLALVVVLAACGGDIVTPGGDGGGALDGDVGAPDLGGAAVDLATRPDLGPGMLKGTVQLTYYWVTQQSDYSGANDTALCDVSTNVLATVPLAFANALKLEGTGKLTDGRLLNVGGSCACSSGMTTCYIVLDQTKYPWGVGVQSRALVPFRSIAVDRNYIPYGTRVYVPEFDGVQMPSSYGFVHDGCFQADDTGGGIVGAHIDFFAAEKSNYQTLDRMLRLSNVTTYLASPRCP